MCSMAYPISSVPVGATMKRFVSARATRNPASSHIVVSARHVLRGAIREVAKAPQTTFAESFAP